MLIPCQNRTGDPLSPFLEVIYKMEFIYFVFRSLYTTVAEVYYLYLFIFLGEGYSFLHEPEMHEKLRSAKRSVNLRQIGKAEHVYGRPKARISYL